MAIVLAGRDADELGAEFAIEFASYEDGAPTCTAQGRRPANNEEASAAFANIVSEMEAKQEHVARMLADSGPGTQFTAVAPLSGEIFTWEDQGRGTDDAE